MERGGIVMKVLEFIKVVKSTMMVGYAMMMGLTVVSPI